jgi:hypothetical protein
LPQVLFGRSVEDLRWKPHNWQQAAALSGNASLDLVDAARCAELDRCAPGRRRRLVTGGVYLNGTFTLKAVPGWRSAIHRRMDDPAASCADHEFPQQRRPARFAALAARKRLRQGPRAAI